MDEKIFVTVGIPMFNAEKFIRESIFSVLQQTHEYFELIISDDGSSDRSVEIVKSFNDPRIVLLSDGENKGISYRLNEQIAVAKGKYFIRMDADDIMFPNRLESQLEFLEKNPDVDVIGSSAVIIDNENNIIGYRETRVPLTVNEAVKSNIFIHPTVCGKTTWFKNFKYQSCMDGAEDYDLWLRTLTSSTFMVSNNPVIFYRDPLEFKIKTYVDRLKRQRLMIKQNEILQGHEGLRMKVILTSYVKGVIAQIIQWTKQDHLIIAKRNSNLDVKNNEIYQRILQQILNKTT